MNIINPVNHSSRHRHTELPVPVGTELVLIPPPQGEAGESLTWPRAVLNVKATLQPLSHSLGGSNAPLQWDEQPHSRPNPGKSMHRSRAWQKLRQFFSPRCLLAPFLPFFLFDALCNDKVNALLCFHSHPKRNNLLLGRTGWELTGSINSPRHRKPQNTSHVPPGRRSGSKRR